MFFWRFAARSAPLVLILMTAGCISYSKMVYPSATYHPAPNDVVEKVRHVDFTEWGFCPLGIPVVSPNVCERLGSYAPRGSGLRLADVEVTGSQLYLGNIFSIPKVHVSADVVRVENGGAK